MSGVNDFLTEDQMTDRTNVNDMDPWDVIESACIGMGIVYNKPNPNCKKCHGRGWTGRRLVPDVDANGQFTVSYEAAPQRSIDPAAFVRT